MKVLLYLEAENFLKKSGIGRAIKHQQIALDKLGIDYTLDPKDDYDIVHINTYGWKSWKVLKQAKRKNKKVIMHGHSTEEDFRDSFIGSNFFAPLFRRYLCLFYNHADYIITPTAYSKSLIQSYGIDKPIKAISNGIDMSRYQYSPVKEEAFYKHFNLSKKDKIVISAGLFFRRKGIEDFVKVAEHFPDVHFIWFGETNKFVIPHQIRSIVAKRHPANVTFAGYIKGDIYEGAMTAADCFFFPSYEETEGIVVLEALASHQNVVLRDIPVYQGWITEEVADLSKDVPGFIAAIERCLNHQENKKDAASKVASSRDITVIAQQLVDAYQEVMEM